MHPVVRLLPLGFALALIGCAQPTPTTPPEAAKDVLNQAAPAGTPASPDGAGAAASGGTIAKAAGGVNAGVDNIQFSFIVHTSGLAGGISCSGQIGGDKFEFLGDAAEVAITPGHVKFNGVGVLAGKPVTFDVEGTDGAFDTFSLAFSNGKQISGQLAHGFVTIE
jgi:hypothetical protein